MENLEGGETVLVVEEETFTRSVAVSMLERYGYTVLTATNGQEVLHMFDSLAFSRHLWKFSVIRAPAPS
jgi:CheY-like chemotaxis protein